MRKAHPLTLYIALVVAVPAASVADQISEVPVAGQTASAETDHPGRNIGIPAQNGEASGHGGRTRVAVVRGDTLESIARKHSISATRLREINGLPENAKLRPGAILVIEGLSVNSRGKIWAPSRPAGKARGGRIPDTVRNRRATQPAGMDRRTEPARYLRIGPKTPGARTYVVKKGDNLWRIAKKFGVRPEDVVRVNGLRHGGVRAGQRLILDVVAPSGLSSGAGLAASDRVIDEERVYEDLKVLSEETGDASVPMTAKDRLIRVAKRMLDIPYRFGGNTLRGIDCSAYVQKVFRFLNIALPRTAREQFRHGEDVTRDELATGDLVFFRTYARFPSHVGIYIGNNRFIHASSVGRKVTIDSLETPYYSRRFIGGKRLVREPAANNTAEKPTEEGAAG